VEQLGTEITELLEFLKSNDFATVGQVPLTNYLLFLIIGIILLTAIFVSGRRRAAVVPQGRFYNLIEVLVEFVRNDVAVATIGAEGKGYFPFLGTVFMFILINDLIGVIPGFKPGTGTMGVTVALAICAFVVFNAAGIKKRGFGHYMTGLVPHGVPKLLWPLIWFIEVFGILIRPFTLSIRLFANMFAGHVVLGIFSILATVAVEQVIEGLHAAEASMVAIGGISLVAWMTLLTLLYILEIGVAMLQAYIFTLLTSVYISLAVSEH
jgi:F-type H+-transporting ATPase subunit a